MTIARRPIASIEQVDGLQTALDAKRALAAAQTPLATYVHSGNPSAVVSAVTYNADTPANTFTSAGHPFVNGARVSICINADNATIDYATKFLPTGMAFGHYYIVGRTDNTFQLSATPGGAPITLTAIATLDLTKWHVELPPATITCLIPTAGIRRVRVVMRGTSSRGQTHIVPNAISYVSNTYIKGTVTTDYSLIALGRIDTHLEAVIDSSDRLSMLITGYCCNPNTATTLSTSSAAVSYVSSVFRAFDITAIILAESYVHNGFRVDIYAD